MACIEPHLEGLSEGQRLTLESWVVEFDQRWDGHFESWLGKLPAPGDPLRRPILVEMVRIDLERRWARGDRVGLEWYLARLPELGGPQSVPADFIAAEYKVRLQFGDSTGMSRYAERFPLQAETVRRLVEDWTTDTVRPGEDWAASARSAQAGPPKVVPLPEKIGHYRILEKLGECGMGTVYLAHDDKLDRRVALKVPRFLPEDDPTVLKRFEREARAAASLEHPNICPVHEVGEADGVHYLTMGYVEGKPLSDFISSKPLQQRAAALLVRKLASALQYAHSEGVIHRDLKPSNVMMKETQEKGKFEPVIIDFGLASRAGKGDPRLTTGAVVGTPAYLAPEQLDGVTRPGPACDVYGLGVVFYQLLTGRLPFEGSLLEVLGQIANQEPPPPSQRRPDLDRRLEGVCLKAMAKKPENRYASMGDLATALTDYLNAAQMPVPAEAKGGALSETVPAPSPPRPAPADRPDGPSGLRRRQWYVWAAVVAAGCLFLILGGLAWRWSRGPAPTSEEPLPPLALHWHGFVSAERGGQEMDLQLKDGMTLFNKEQYRLVLTPTADCYLYVVGVEDQGPELLFPHAGIQVGNRCRANKEYQLPDGNNWYTLDNRPGTETTYLIASHERLPELEELLAKAKQERAGAAERLEALVQTLAKKSAEGLKTRGQTIEPDRRTASARLKSGKEVTRQMELDLGAGYVVRRIRFEHKAPSR